MLVLTRKLQQSIMIGQDIEVTVLAMEGEQIKLGIVAPKHVALHRKEVYVAIEAENNAAVAAPLALMSQLKQDCLE
ncbi:carbon storage regulator [Fictibacillus macauensis ZFHKF-1]|uniref:Translational regulator CsrA n=1 Tax=Fictibacillus macauensis ZFHKF-1 TaxID=1196324 RepID=I8AMP5_9BACL|nr:carbon storage regulator CsrA [Fictibacillus macauensis]EIT86944.1 carbon storage regulator [Fictibacillus macauensis ZFHKF-1]